MPQPQPVPDTDDDSIYHTLGLNRHQAMPGDVLSGFTVSGSRPADPFLRQVLEALKTLGAKDATT